MKKNTLLASASVGLFAASALLAPSAALAGGGGGGHPGGGQGKATICHHTGSATNPFVKISVPWKAGLKGHAKHGDFVIFGEEECPTPRT